MFKKKKEYEINIYQASKDPCRYDRWGYDVHLDGKLIKSGTTGYVELAKMYAQNAAEEHAQLGKYKYKA